MLTFGRINVLDLSRRSKRVAEGIITNMTVGIFTYLMMMRLVDDDSY